jgi:hypothetical protein
MPFNIECLGGICGFSHGRASNQERGLGRRGGSRS